MSPFLGSPNKTLIRQCWDSSLIEAWAQPFNNSLYYFGLPGPQIADLLAWRPYLGYATGVERLRRGQYELEDLDVHRKLINNVMLNNFTERFQLLRGMVEDIIINGLDSDRQRPRMSTNEHPLVAKFQYTLVNLDFVGGISGKIQKSGESKRIKALKKLFERQRGTNFILLLTLNVRDSIGDEIISYLMGATKDFQSLNLNSYSEILTWYAECPDGMKHYKLKAMVPLFIRREAQHWGFECNCHPPIAYEGNGKARMVHFVFEIVSTATVLHAFSSQTDVNVINLPLLQVFDEILAIAPEQHPKFDFAQCYNMFNFLAPNIRDSLLETLPPSA